MDDRSLRRVKPREHLVWSEFETCCALARPIEANEQSIARKPWQPTFNERLSAQLSWTEKRISRHYGDHVLDARTTRPKWHCPSAIDCERGRNTAVILNSPDGPVLTHLPVERVRLNCADTHSEKLAQTSLDTRSFVTAATSLRRLASALSRKLPRVRDPRAFLALGPGDAKVAIDRLTWVAGSASATTVTWLRR